MLNISKAVVTIIFISVVGTLYGQSTEAIGNLKANSDEILLIKVTTDSSFFLMENFRCYSSAHGDVIEIFKQKKIPPDRKKIIVFHSAKCSGEGFPPAMKLAKGTQYFVFLSTDKLNKEEVKNDRSNTIQFSVTDYYLGILEYNED